MDKGSMDHQMNLDQLMELKVRPSPSVRAPLTVRWSDDRYMDTTSAIDR
jgi:hypothetical protein